MVRFPAALTAAAVFLAAALVFSGPAAGDDAGPWWNKGWAVTGWAGRLTTENTTDLWTGNNWTFENSYAGALAVSKELTPLFGSRSALEAELQTLRHFGGQDHWEFTAMLLFRWTSFPWDDTVDTSFAIGDGLSYPTETPAEELYNHGPGNSAQLLNSVMMEATFADPDAPDFQYVLRYHHRSGFFRTFSDVGEASTLFGVGVKKRF